MTAANDAELARQLAEQGDEPLPLFDPTCPTPQPVLTDRQLQVLALVAEGVPTHRIGTRLGGLTAATIKTHVRHAAARAGVRGRCRLVAWGFRTGHLRWVRGRVVVDPTPQPTLFWLDSWRPVEDVLAEAQALMAGAA